MKESFREFYRGLILLEGYCDLNYHAFQKILKKYDKTFGTNKKFHYLNQKIDPCEFHKQEKLKLIITEIEVIYILM